MNCAGSGEVRQLAHFYSEASSLVLAGASRSLTVPGVHPETPVVSREADENEKLDIRV